MEGHYALKIIAEGVSHKSDQGGVILGLPDMEALKSAFEQMISRFKAIPECNVLGALAQEMIPMRPGAFEMIIGAKRDPQFGPVVMLGHGGIFVEILAKVCLRLAPVSPGEVDRMIEELPGAEAFHGVRGFPPVNIRALKDAVLRVSWLMTNFEEIDQIDINPFVVSDSQAYALDARIIMK
jgi:acetyltransferase